jgi:molybdenum cofactor biosynthesis enzyme MoaA
MQEVRASILQGKVHDICRTTNCPHQQPNDAFTPPEATPFFDKGWVDSFDENRYLGDNPDVAAAVLRLEFVSGLEHFVKFGRAEGRSYSLTSRRSDQPRSHAHNAMLALSEHSRGATEINSSPVDVVLQISSICNLKCVMCGHGVGAVENKRHMLIEVVDRAGPMLHTASRMIFSGMGEPFLAPAFWKVIANFGREQTVFIRANSNGHFVTGENARQIMDSGLKEISFSLDAATPETYTKIRGGDFGKALSGVSTMCDARRNHSRGSLEIFINMTLMCENVSEAPAFVDLAYRLKVDAIIFGQLLKFGDQPSWVAPREVWTFRYSEQMLRNCPDLATRYITEAKKRAEILGLKLIFLHNTDQYISDVTPVVAVSLIEDIPVEAKS